MGALFRVCFFSWNLFLNDLTTWKWECLDGRRVGAAAVVLTLRFDDSFREQTCSRPHLTPVFLVCSFPLFDLTATATELQESGKCEIKKLL